MRGVGRAGFWTGSMALCVIAVFGQGMGSGIRSAAHPKRAAAVRKLPPPPFEFQDVAAKIGISGRNHYGGSSRYILEITGNGVGLIDFDNDGHTDVLLPDGKAPYLYRNRGDGTFQDATAGSGLRPREWGQGVCAGDIDNDGWTDVFLTHYGPNVLYRNRKGTFEDITAAAGLPTTGSRFSTSCAFFDYDRDGLLDLIVANYVKFDLKTAQLPGATKYCTWKGLDVFCGPRGFPTDLPVLYHNEGNGRFRDVSGQALRDISGLHYGLGVVSSDFDDDGWPDVYIACDSTPGILLHNNRDGTLSDVAVAAGAAYGRDGQELGSMGVAAVDVDGDGRFELVKTNFIDETPSLYRNLGELFFEDATVETGLSVNANNVGWGVAAADFDQDGRPDLFMANGHIYPQLGDAYRQPKSFYWNAGGMFTEVADPVLGVPAPSRGVAVGDLDHDGTLELVVSNVNASPSVFRNKQVKGNSIELRLQGVSSNRSAIGARVRVTAGRRTQSDEVRSGGSYASQHDFILHFGLGEEAMVQRVEIRWPNGDPEVLQDIPAGARVTIREGAGVIKTEPWR